MIKMGKKTDNTNESSEDLKKNNHLSGKMTLFSFIVGGLVIYGMTKFDSASDASPSPSPSAALPTVVEESPEAKVRLYLDTLAMRELEAYASDPDQLGYLCDKVTNLNLVNKRYGLAAGSNGSVPFFPAIIADFDGTCIKVMNGERDHEFVGKFGIAFAADIEAGRLRCHKISTTDGVEEHIRNCQFRETYDFDVDLVLRREREKSTSQ